MQEPQVGVVAEVVEVWQKVLVDLPELKDVDDARMGIMPDKQYVFSQNNEVGKSEPIYKRKYEVLGMTITQQEAYMKAFNRAVRKAKSLDSVKALVTLDKEGGAGLSRDEVRLEFEKLMLGDRLAGLFFKDVLPEVKADPVQDAVTGVVITTGIIVATLLFCFCVFPPIPPED